MVVWIDVQLRNKMNIMLIVILYKASSWLNKSFQDSYWYEILRNEYTQHILCCIVMIPHSVLDLSKPIILCAPGLFWPMRAPRGDTVQGPVVWMRRQSPTPRPLTWARPEGRAPGGRPSSTVWSHLHDTPVHQHLKVRTIVCSSLPDTLHPRTPTLEGSGFSNMEASWVMMGNRR